MEKIQINEGMHLEKQWFKEAEKQTLDTLPAFISHLMNDYEHDYGTVCHAIGACAIAAAWAANSSGGGGITGFQAGFVMWDFVRQWSFENNKCGLRIIDFDNMLYPQYCDKFEKTIRKDTWNALQKEAKKRLESRDHAYPDVLEHWNRIANGEIPFGYTISEE